MTAHEYKRLLEEIQTSKKKVQEHPITLEKFLKALSNIEAVLDLLAE